MMKKYSAYIVCGFALFASNLTASTTTLYSREPLELFADEALSRPIGQLEAIVPLLRVQTAPKSELVELTMWRRTKGLGRVWYHQFAQNIVDAVLEKQFMQQKPGYQVLAEQEDPLSGLIWQQVRLQAWIAPDQLTNDVASLWTSAAQTYQKECSMCHKAPELSRADANGWISIFKGMVGNTNMDETTAKTVLRYLQLHAQPSQPTLEPEAK